MKVLILATDIYTRGGIARYTWALASALGDLAGLDNVHVLALLDSGGSEDAPKCFRILDTVAQRPTRIAKLRFAGKALKQARQKYDLIVCSHLALTPIAALARHAFGTPFWVTCYGIEAWRCLPLRTRLALQHAALVLPISCYTAGKIAEANGASRDKIRLLHIAVPDELAGLLASPKGLATPVRANGERSLLSVGMLAKGFAYKGFDTVLRALPKVLEAIPRLRYSVVGNGDDSERLRKLAVDLGVEKHVEFAGEVSEADLAAYYRACDVFVLPSRVRQINGKWEGEGFGIVYAEAALAGKPVVGSRDGGAAEAVLHGKTGLLVDPASVSDVAGALIALLQDPELMARMGCEGQRWARENFTTSVLRRRLGEMLGSLGSSPP